MTKPRQLAPTVGLSAASAGVMFRTGTFLHSGERVTSGLINQPDAFARACTGASTDEVAVCPADCLIIPFGKLNISVMIDSDEYPRNVMVIDDPLPPAASDVAANALGVCVFAEVMVTGASHHSDGCDRDPLQAAVRDLAAPVDADADPAVLEGIRVKLLDEATKLAAMHRHAEANQREIDRIEGSTPAVIGPSWAGPVRQHGVAIARMLGVRLLTYGTLAQNLCAAQAAVEELKALEGDELHSQVQCLQDLLDAVNMQQDTCNRAVMAGIQADLPDGNLHPR